VKYNSCKASVMKWKIVMQASTGVLYGYFTKFTCLTIKILLNQDSVESATVSVSKRLVIESLLEIVRLKRRKQAFE